VLDKSSFEISEESWMNFDDDNKPRKEKSTGKNNQSA
jgi:hypothetical protein